MKEFKKIDCSVICDLIPLCRDGVASQASEELVMEHIKTCENCRREFYEDVSSSEHELEIAPKEDKKIIGAIRIKMAKLLTVLLFAGAVLGVAVTSGIGVFFNFTIMPLIGLMAYFALRPRFYIAPLSVGAMALLYGAFQGELLSYGMYALIYMWLIMIGYFAGFLMRFAFCGREEKSKKPRFCGKISIIVTALLCLIPVFMYIFSVVSTLWTFRQV